MDATRRLRPVPLLRLGLAVAFLLPLAWAVAVAFRPAAEIARPLLAGSDWSLDSFRRLFAVLPVLRFTANSLLVVAVAVPLTLLTASAAGFAMARLPRPSRQRWVLLSLLVLIVPSIALWPARFLIYSALGLTDTLWALIAPAVMGTSPFFVLMFYRAFRRIPTAIYDAAVLDGAGVLAAWWRVALPIARPTALAVAALSFIVYWGDYLSPLLYLSDTRAYTLPVGLQLLLQLGRTDYPLLIAGAIWATALPAIIVVAVALLMASSRNKRTKERYVD